MRFAVVTLGSAGDLHPFLAVARALAERGHEVHVLTQAPYESEVRAEGVGFVPIVAQAEHDRTLSHPLLWHPLHGFGVLWRHLAVPAIGPTIEALDALSRNGGLSVLASPLAAGARLARERWPERLRLLSGYTAPMGLRSIADPMFLGGWRVPPWLPSSARRLGWAALDRWKLQPMALPVLRQWSERLGLPPPTASLFGDALHSPDGGLALYPCWFAPVPPAWAERGVRQTGFPVFEPSAPPAVPAAVGAFIADPRPYVVVYPGSAARHGDTFAERSLAACRALGLRALVLSRAHSKGPARSADVLRVDSAPLSRVLPGASAFIHHGGVGSAAQALALRTPQLVLASAYDQFENGARLQRLRQGQWQRAVSASPRSIQNALTELTAGGRSPALLLPPCASRAGVPNPDVEEACEMLEEMPNQPSLPGLDSAPAALELDRPASREKLTGYSLFMAIVPSDDTARRLAEAGAAAGRRLGLQGRPVSYERLHITLHSIASFPPGRPPTRVWADAAIAAGNSIICPPLALRFASAMTFPESGAFVLRCDADSELAIARLRRLLTHALRQARLHPKAAATPHMTLLYDQRLIPEHEIEPLFWSATRFALILSHVGCHHHQRLHEWPLRDSV